MKRRIRFLTSSFGNDSGDIVTIHAEDSQSLCYYDTFRRWCYVEKVEEGESFERVGKWQYECDTALEA